MLIDEIIRLYFIIFNRDNDFDVADQKGGEFWSDR